MVETTGYVQRAIIEQLYGDPNARQARTAAKLMSNVRAIRSHRGDGKAGVSDSLKTTVYRALSDLQEKGLVESERRTVDGLVPTGQKRPERRHYQLTEQGWQEAKRLHESYQTEARELAMRYGVDPSFTVQFGGRDSPDS